MSKNKMTNERKAELYEMFASFIFEMLDDMGKDEDEIKAEFLDLGMTEEEYHDEIEL